MGDALAAWGFAGGAVPALADKLSQAGGAGGSAGDNPSLLFGTSTAPQ